MQCGVMLVTSDATDGELQQLGPDATWYVFDVGDDQTALGFFESVMRNLPQDPPLTGRGGVKWEALSDSIWGDPAERHPKGGNVVVHWRDASRMRVADRATYDMVLDIFEDMAESIGDVRYNPAPLRVLVLVGESTPD